MLFLIPRILLAPLAVVAGTLAQRRFGHGIGGLIVGLPLASLPLLWLVALQHGTAFTSSMTGALLVGSIAEAVILWLYARLTIQVSPSLALLGALSAFALVAEAANLLKLSALLAGLITALGFVVALRWWPVTPSDPAAPQGHSRLGLRVAFSAVFTVAIVSLAGRLGPVLTGLLDALPAMSLMMAFMTHQDHGADASSRFLQGVTRGSFSYLAAMIVLAQLLRTGNLLLAFSAALAAALLVQGSIQAHDTFAGRTRTFVPSDEVCSQDSSEVLCA
ncbi:MAG: hypothetical protein ACRDVC_06975 [Acidimicrobiales bacterium]